MRGPAASLFGGRRERVDGPFRASSRTRSTRPASARRCRNVLHIRPDFARCEPWPARVTWVHPAPACAAAPGTRRNDSRSDTLCPQGGERQGMRGLVGKVEPALGRQAFDARIGEALPARLQQALEFSSRARLGLELADPDEVIEFPAAHGRGRAPNRR